MFFILLQSLPRRNPFVQPFHASTRWHVSESLHVVPSKHSSTDSFASDPSARATTPLTQSRLTYSLLPRPSARTIPERFPDRVKVVSSYRLPSRDGNQKTLLTGICTYVAFYHPTPSFPSCCWGHWPTTEPPPATPGAQSLPGG